MRQNVLVVDDIPENLELLCGMLEKHGYVVRPVPSGEIALMTARIEPPDLVLLDIDMPEMDGYEVCTRFKADKLLKDVPIIFITAMTETMDKIKAFSVGGVDYITKPFEVPEVEARIKTHLTIIEQRRKLQESADAKYYNIFNNVINGLFQATPEGNIIVANGAFLKMHGCSTLEQFNLQRRRFVRSNDFSDMTSRLQHAGFIEQFETEVVRNDGNSIWISINARAVKDGDSVLLYYEGIVEDITERKKAQERERRIEKELRALIKAMKDVIMVVDKNGKYLNIDPDKPGRPYMTGNDFVGRPMRELYGKESEVILRCVRKALLTNKTINIEYSIKKEGKECWCSAAISPIVNDLALCVARDITELKNITNSLQSKSIRLEEANTALKVLLEKMEESKKEYETITVSNIRQFIIPYVDKIRITHLSDTQKSYMNLIESGLTEIISPFLKRIDHCGLTPTELQIANLIKDGKRTKDIVNLLNSSKGAIDIHRYNIRRKLGLNNQKVNLRSYLMSLG